MQTETCHPEALKQQARDSYEWFRRSALSLSDVITDQRLILDGYRIRFALDFSELYQFLHPWGSSTEGESELDSVLATAFTMYQRGRNPPLRKTLLIPEYLEELDEHVMVLANAGVEYERQILHNMAHELESQPTIRQAHHDNAPDLLQWYEQHREDVLHLLRADFPKLARVALSSELNYTPHQRRILRFNLGHYFDGPDALGDDWPVNVAASPLYPELLTALHAAVQHNKSAAPPRSHALQLSCDRDARALCTVIEINRALQRRQAREIVYLLTSSPRFYSAMSTRAEFRHAAEVSLPTREFGTLTTAVIRHPFCIIAFLAHWPTASDLDDTEARRKLLRRCGEINLQVPLLLTSTRERLAFVERNCTGAWDTCGHQSECVRIQEELDSYDVEFGSWINLALSLQRCKLLLSTTFTIRGILKRVGVFVQAISTGVLKTRVDADLQGRRDERYLQVARARFDLIRDLVRSRVTPEAVQKGVAGPFVLFPFDVRFRDPDVRQRVRELREACRVPSPTTAELLREHVDSARAAVNALVGILDPTTHPELSPGEATILAVSLILLLAHPNQARRFVLRFQGLDDEYWETEREYLRLLVEYRLALETNRVGVVKRVAALAAEFLKAVPQDRRVGLIGLTLTMESVLASEEISAASGDTLARRFEEFQTTLAGELSLEQDEDRRLTLSQLLFRTANNRTYLLLRLGDRLARADLCREALEVAKRHVEPQLEEWPIQDIRHTVGLAYLRFAQTCADESERQKCFRKSNDLLSEVDAHYDELIVKSPERRAELTKHLAEARDGLSYTGR